TLINFFYTDTSPTVIYTISLHDALPICLGKKHGARFNYNRSKTENKRSDNAFMSVKIPDEAKNYIIKYSESLFRRYKTIKSLNRSEEHTSELQSRENLVCRLLLEKKNTR